MQDLTCQNSDFDKELSIKPQIPNREQKCFDRKKKNKKLPVKRN